MFCVLVYSGARPAVDLSARCRDRIEKREIGLEKVMSKDLQQLIESSRMREFSPSEREEQRRSFAYGNTRIENSRITRSTVDRQAELLKGTHREAKTR
jgi:hypothetical protein